MKIEGREPEERGRELWLLTLDPKPCRRKLVNLLAHLALSDITLAIAIYSIGAASGFAVARLFFVRSN